MDFGCAEKIGTEMQYQQIDTAKYAIEYMPPEYIHEGTQACIANEVFSITLTLAEILGMNKKLLVEDKLARALSKMPDGAFKDELHHAFHNYPTLDDAIFLSNFSKFTQSPEFTQFIQIFVQEPYDFSSYQNKYPRDILQLLNDMQQQNPTLRPSIKECAQRLDRIKLETSLSVVMLRKLSMFSNDSIKHNDTPEHASRNKP